MWVIWVFALLFVCVCVFNGELHAEWQAVLTRWRRSEMWERKQAPYPASNTPLSDVPGFGLLVQKDLGYRDFRLLACRTAFILSSSSWKCRLGVSDRMSVVKCWRWSVGDKVLSDHVLVECWWVVGCKGLVLKCCWSVHLGTHDIFWIMHRKIWWHLTFFYTHLSGSVTSSVWM